ncbi:hypothetical protein L1987_42561 [Smallanthus sonchifolius]|uniref:Uncharacterized protein n=1 Tax=Smallanthus sonchifolius TaxID=185202 RepID=A0ACB9GJY8_9ASTR|nr:hypothetical protein L1987_42561 [Smallanthus sonchifolius]
MDTNVAKTQEVFSEDPFDTYEVISELNKQVMEGMGVDSHELNKDVVSGNSTKAMAGESNRGDFRFSGDSSNPKKPHGFEKFKTFLETEKGVEISSAFKDCGTSALKGGSIVNDISRIIEIGNVMGFDMEGCTSDLGKLINRMMIIDGETSHVHARERGSWASNFIRKVEVTDREELVYETEDEEGMSMNDSEIEGSCIGQPENELNNDDPFSLDKLVFENNDPIMPIKRVNGKLGDKMIDESNKGKDQMDGESLSTPPRFDGRVGSELQKVSNENLPGFDSRVFVGEEEVRLAYKPVHVSPSKGEKAGDSSVIKLQQVNKGSVEGLAAMVEEDSVGSYSFKLRKTKVKKKCKTFHGGSLINSILRNIEVAKVLGYDMSGSKDDLANY